MAQAKKAVKGFKAFKKGLVCNDYKYEIGKEHVHEGDIKLCLSGFHFCLNPLDVLDYYPLLDTEFAEVEATGKVIHEDNKSVTDKIVIKTKLELPAFIKASIDFVWEQCKLEVKDFISKAIGRKEGKLAASGDYSQLAASGHYSKLAASGYDSQLAASGDDSQLAASGYSSKLAASGHSSVVASIGVNGVASGIKRSWIVLAEYEWDGKYYKPLCVKTAQIDGEKLKENTYYKLEKGEFVDCGAYAAS